MKVIDIAAALGALAHPHRLAVFKMLAARGAAGLPAGLIAERTGLAPSSLTFHLNHLRRAGLISQRRHSRQLIYDANCDVIERVVQYLSRHCAGSGMGTSKHLRR